MEPHKKNVISGITGTLTMTLFSHWIAKATDEKFQEQKLLNTFLNRSLPTGKADISGWIIHLLMGVALSYLDFRLIKSSNRKATVGKGLFYGAIDGIIGMVIWRIVFRLHPDPPKIDLHKYLMQLFIAHLVFGVVAATTHRALN